MKQAGNIYGHLLGTKANEIKDSWQAICTQNWVQRMKP